MGLLFATVTLVLLVCVSCYPLEEKQPKRRIYTDIREAVRDMWPMKRSGLLASSDTSIPNDSDLEQPMWMVTLKRNNPRRRVSESDLNNLLRKTWIL